MRLIVQKFGGTSVASAQTRQFVVDHILRAKNEGYRPVVVVSAMGRVGDPYATDTLISLARSIKPEVNPRELDLLMSCGEIISSIVLVQTLRAFGHRAAALTGGQAGIITDDQFGRARIVEVRPETLLEYIRQGTIPVVAGFQGRTPDGEVTTLGRGGSDTTATALGVALEAECVEIYTDVDGIMTADPRVVPEARILKHATYREVVELAHLGAKVIHPRAVEIAMEKGIPIRVRPVHDDSPGTLITSDNRDDRVEILGDRLVNGIAHVSNAVYVQVSSAEDLNKSGLALRILSRVSEMDISIDCILVSPHRLSFITCSDADDKLKEILKAAEVEYSVERGFAKVSVVGAGMTGVPGVMARVVKALHEVGVRIWQTTDSHCNISCLIKEEDLPVAVRALHQAFLLGKT